MQEIETRWAARGSQHSTLITTRSTEYAALGKCLDLEMLSEDEAFRLLTWRKPPPDSGASAAARAIVRELGCHPLGVEVAGSYLGRGLETYPSYLGALRVPNSGAIEFGAKLREALPTGHERSISSTLLRSTRLLGPNGRAFLELAAVLAVAPIPLKLAREAFRHWPGWQPDLVRGIADVDSLGLAVASDGGDARMVHTLINRTVRDLTLDGGTGMPLAAATHAAVTALIELLAPAALDVRRHGEIRREVVHGRHLAASGLGDRDTASLASWIWRYDYHRGDYNSARRLSEQVLASSSWAPHHRVSQMR